MATSSFTKEIYIGEEAAKRMIEAMENAEPYEPSIDIKASIARGIELIKKLPKKELKSNKEEN